MAETLDQFVQKQRAAGAYDSSDVFTLDTLQMGRKMAAYQLPERGLWVVKLIQGAVRLQAETVTVRFGRRTVEVQFEAGVAGPDSSEIFQAVFQPLLKPPAALAHICSGLRACLGFEPERLRWEVRGPEGGSWYEMTRASTESGDLPPTLGSQEYRFELTRRGKRPALKKALRQRVVDLVREVGEEYTALVSRCWCAPLTLEIDGVDLETSLAHPAMRHLTDTKLVGCGVDRYHMGDHWLALRPLRLNGVSSAFSERYLAQSPTGEEMELTTKVESRTCFLRWPRQEGANAQLLVSFASLVVPGIDFFHDGAVVDQVDFPYSRPLRPMDRMAPAYQRQAVGYRLFVNLEADRLDLSGFGVREHEELAAELYLQIRGDLLSTLAQLEHLIDNYRFSAYKRKSKGRFFDRMLAPLSVLNHGFVRAETRRTLEQLKNHVQKSPSRREMF